MLYVLDEPTAGLHPQDVERLLAVIRRLHRRENTLVVVEHNPKCLLVGERIVEIGPEQGEQGGQIVFDGPSDSIVEADTITAQYLNLSLIHI